MYHIYLWLGKKRFKKTTKRYITAPILKLTYDQKLETFLLALTTQRNKLKQ